MNKKIYEVEYSKILGVDIETVRGQKDFNEYSHFFDLWAWKCRDRNTNEIPDTKDVISKYYKKAPLYAEWGKIVCISVGYINNGRITTKSFTGDEKDIIDNFLELASSSGRILAVHNKSFDLPYIQKRFMHIFKGKKRFPDFYNNSGLKPWETDEYCIDTMDIWKMIGWQNTSLAELCMTLGIDSPKDDINGSEVSKVFYEYENGIDRISKYCEKDVASVLNIIRVLKGDDPVKHETKKVSKKITYDGTILQYIMETGMFDKKVQKELKLKLSKSNNKEKELAKDIILAHYQKPKSRKKDKETRAEVINKFFEEIK